MEINMMVIVSGHGIIPARTPIIRGFFVEADSLLIKFSFKRCSKRRSRPIIEIRIPLASLKLSIIFIRAKWPIPVKKVLRRNEMSIAIPT